MKTLVIGYGNALCRDDGVGLFVAQHIEPSPNLRVIACQQLTPELAEPVSQADCVIFVDAHAEIPAGEIVVQSIEPRKSPLIHQLDAGTLLAWSRKLYGRAPEAVLVGIGGESFDLGEGLSPAVERAAQKALETIHGIISRPDGVPWGPRQ
ncbi:MAG: hydrogenase maturation protease [Bryobacteraceae bacterium]|jgi:hydrogenase maturation protease